jgi:hypothetical protein
MDKEFMNDKHFTREEAQRKSGTRIRTLREFSGVPKGTEGTVVNMYPSCGFFGLDVQWDLPGRFKPLVDGFSKWEYETFLQEIPMIEKACIYCGKPFAETAIFAMLIDLGCRGSDPLYCPASKDHQHSFVKKEVKQ